MATSGSDITASKTCICGFTFIELLISLLIGSMLMLGIGTALSASFRASDAVHTKNALNRQAGFAMQRMQRALGHSRRILLPLGDNSYTASVQENERDVVAVTLAHDIDADGDGVADADNDADGRFDEDLPADSNNDGASGIVAIDDDADGFIDESTSANDDESLGIPLVLAASDEDPLDGTDDDADGTIDEDPPADMNGDGKAGVSGVDDDGDGVIDEGDRDDDDEDGLVDEDWYDSVVFYLNGSDLIERTPVPWDANASGAVDGSDFVEQVIAENVTVFTVVREPVTDERFQLVSLTLALAAADGQSVQLGTQVRIGGAL